MRTAVAALALAAAPLAAAAAPAPVAAELQGTLLSIAADAEVKAKPDLASLTIGVTTEAETAQAAVAANAERMNAVMAALRKAGIAERDLQTDNLSVSPEYSYEEGRAPQIEGYSARNTVRATARNLDRLGRVIDAVAAAGSNTIEGVSFGVDKPDAALDQARREAIAKARARAELYAEAAGLRVARILSITEAGAEPPRPEMFMIRAAPVAMAAPTPIAPGEVGLSAAVSVVFELR